MTVRAKLTSRLSTSWRQKTENNADSVALQMAADVDRFAKVLAPKDKGNLVNSGRIEKMGLAEYKASFGGSHGGVSVRYAKRRHYENKKNPQTLKFLERAGNAVSKQKKKYLKGERPRFK